uniref:Uncharacterized protein n=1 Tax=Phlebotomus papatasi TaxID=29031 RepID=A0A1B0DDQ9_PHLPP
MNNLRHLPRKPRWENPGIDGRIEMLKEEKTAVIEPEDVEEDFESDFMNVGEMHKKYKEEERWHREKVAYWITRDKYFKVKQQNFLTWSEKEQIRFLNRDSPSEWTAEKLADSFPADLLTIKKVLKSNWLPGNEQRILKHDNQVQRNWEAFRGGKCENLSKELRVHLQKFAHRKFNLAATPKIHLENTRENALKLPSGEFSKIITSCKAYESPKQVEEKPQEIKYLEASGKPASKHTHITLNELKKSEDSSPRTTSEDSPVPISRDEMQIFNVKQFNSAPVLSRKEFPEQKKTFARGYTSHGGCGKEEEHTKLMIVSTTMTGSFSTEFRE